MKRIVFVSLAAMALMACTAKAEPNNYKVIAENPQMEEGALVYMLNYDTSDKMDSTIVANGQAIFEGKIEAPVFVRLVTDGNRLDMFILEKGDITVKDGDAVGTPLNAQLSDFGSKIAALENRFGELPQDDEAGREAVYNEYLALNDSVMNANIDNPIGYYLFV